MGTTPKGLPYPEGTDPVADGDDAIQALAEAIDAMMAAGVEVRDMDTITNVPGNSAKGKTVTFVAGRFTAAPAVTVSMNATSPGSWDSPSVRNITTASVTIYIGNTNASTRDGSYSMIAVQGPDTGTAALAATALGLDENLATATVTCPTSGCPNQGVAITVPIESIDEDTGEHIPTESFGCGGCGADLTPIPD